MNKKTRNTAVLVILLLSISAAGLLVRYIQGQKTGAYAVLTKAGEVLYRLPLSGECQLTVGEKTGGYNRVVLQDGEISVTDADCPNHDCIRQGAIKDPGQVIACLPHDLIITIESDDENAVDSSAW